MYKIIEKHFKRMDNRIYEYLSTDDKEFEEYTEVLDHLAYNIIGFDYPNYDKGDECYLNPQEDTEYFIFTTSSNTTILHINRNTNLVNIFK